DEMPVAEKLTSPADVNERRVVTSTTLSTIASARAAPTAAFSPAAAPDAFVETCDDCVAERLTLPLAFTRPPAPIRAAVLLDTIERPRTGVKAMPPAAPDFASVVTLWSPLAARSIAPAFAKATPSATSAVARLATIAVATEAPTPTLPPLAPSPTGRALVVVAVRFSAEMERERSAPVNVSDAPLAMVADF